MSLRFVEGFGVGIRHEFVVLMFVGLVGMWIIIVEIGGLMIWVFGLWVFVYLLIFITYVVLVRLFCFGYFGVSMWVVYFVVFRVFCLLVMFWCLVIVLECGSYFG